MPFKSEKQRRWMHANDPDMADEWEKKKKKEALSASEFKAAHKKFKKTGELPPHLKKLVKDLDKVKVKYKVKNIVVPGLEWMSKIKESLEEAERDYKDEYKKFQSSTKAKKYRAELNKYNRKKGTYGNGDGKDASHKGGKIVGFESQSKNRGRAEKSRLKKEDIRQEIEEYVDGILDGMGEEFMVNEEKECMCEACQKGYMTHPTRKTKVMFGKRYRNCIKKEGKVDERKFNHKKVGDHYMGGENTPKGDTEMFADKKGRYYVWVKPKGKKARYIDLPKNVKDRSKADDLHRKIAKTMGESVNEAKNTVGTKNYNGQDWFWPHDYRHYLRDANARQRKLVHNGWLKIGVPVKKSGLKISDRYLEPKKNQLKKAWDIVRKVVAPKELGMPIPESVDEGKYSKIMKAVRKGPKAGPWQIIVSKNNKVVKEVPVKTLQLIPAHYDDIKKAYPNHKIGIEAKDGKIVYRESVNEGSCGYGIDGKLGDKPAGPHLMKKKKKKDEVSLGGRMAKKIGKHGGTRDKGEIAKILKLLIKRGNKKKDAMDMINKNYDRVSKAYRKASPAKKAEILSSLQEAVKLRGKSKGTISHVGMPPASKGVEKLFKIADGGFGKVGGQTVDSMSANLFKQIYDKASDDIKLKLNKKNEKQLVMIISKMWNKFGKNVSIGSSI